MIKEKLFDKENEVFVKCKVCLLNHTETSTGTYHGCYILNLFSFKPLLIVQIYQLISCNNLEGIQEMTIVISSKEAQWPSG